MLSGFPQIPGIPQFDDEKRQGTLQQAAAQYQPGAHNPYSRLHKFPDQREYDTINYNNAPGIEGLRQKPPGMNYDDWSGIRQRVAVNYEPGGVKTPELAGLAQAFAQQKMQPSPAATANVMLAHQRVPGLELRGITDFPSSILQRAAMEYGG